MLAAENARFCMAAVRANGTTRTPLSAERRDRLPRAPTLADRARLGRRVQGLHCSTGLGLSICFVVAYTRSPWNCKIRVLIFENTVREARLCILLKNNRPTPGVIVDRNLVYVQNLRQDVRTSSFRTLTETLSLRACEKGVGAQTTKGTAEKKIRESID